MIVAANLKTNLTRNDTTIYIKKIDSFAQTTSQDVFVFPAMSSLGNFHTKKTIVGAQNAYPTINGAYTGEIGLEHLEEFQLKTILIGHSERRHILGETQEFIVNKFNFFKEKGFKIIYCIGEPLEIREMGNETMMQYISAQYEGIDTEYENLIIAYEPVWAIGTGLTPTLENIQSIHAKLKQKSSAPLLYGGSVKVNNTKDVLSLANVDGILVGSAALNAADFSTMIEIAQSLEE